MLGRRILRIKAFKVIYSYAVTGNMTLAQAKKQFDDSLEATRDLYLFMLSMVSPLTRVAAERLEARRQKFNPSEEDLNPNDKFATNALARLLDEDIDFQKIIAKKKFSWDQYDIVLKTILDSLAQKKYFSKYMENPARSLAEDCSLFTRIFEEELSDLDSLRDLLEEKSLYWYDDLEYALTQCCKTFESLARGGRWRLPELYLSDEILRRKPSADVSSDSDFAHKLLAAAFTGYEKVFEKVVAAVPDWDSDRLFLTDIAIIDLGVAEHKTFPDIPLDVTLSEWVEISKDFCSPKSRQFVNSLMDKIIKEII
ncbi:MAG: hypothetical protein IKR15_07140 [Bacteroidales bacterium]|nr:hypothetical protein [Bacteroidales bacterium]